MKPYRNLTASEIALLEQNHCSATDWTTVMVSSSFDTRYITHTRFSGRVILGRFEGELELPGGIKKHSGLKHVTLHNVTIGNNCCIENVKNYIANYDIGHHVFIDNVDIILVDKISTFGNGTGVSVLNETGGREVYIHNQLSAHEAYIMALYRHRPDLIQQMQNLVADHARKMASDRGKIASHVVIVNTGYIKNVNIGEACVIEGAGRLKNGSINSTAAAPVHIGYGVVCDDFIISSGSSVEDGTMLSRCFVGQSCRFGHTYSASDSLFFSNCQEENGEACAIFAGPFTVTHHKSTLLIAGMFSFMNAGSGSNQSNHMYKLGPIHQGMLERGAKTTSDSYILWPARVGAFSLVMGRHVNHLDTTRLPFSYLIEDNNMSYIVPAVNLKSVGTIRDAQKWPRRDNRKDPFVLDQINYNLLSPYTIQNMMKGRHILAELARISGPASAEYAYQGAKIRNSSLHKGIKLYEMAIQKFLGNSVIKRLEGICFASDADIRARLAPDTHIGLGEWVDVSGLIAPKTEIDRLIASVVDRSLSAVDQYHDWFGQMHAMYYTYEWTWAYHQMLQFYGLDSETISASDIIAIVEQWKAAVVGLDKMLYDDAHKEFTMAFMTGFGADGTHEEQLQDFEQVRGDFESNPFVKAVTDHIAQKTALGNELIARLLPLVPHQEN